MDELVWSAKHSAKTIGRIETPWDFEPLFWALPLGAATIGMLAWYW